MWSSTSYSHLFRIITLFLLLSLSASTAPDDPIQCKSLNTDCTITNSYGNFSDRSICKAKSVVYPTTLAEVISTVAMATQTRRKMKVATRFSHSIPKLVCPDGEDGLLISTNYLNRTLKIDVDAMTITVESGVTLRQIINDAATAGLALSNTPDWWGLTIGGLLSTGAHGSSLWGKGGALHEYVVEIQIVTPGRAEDGFAKVRTLVDGDEHLNAAKVSLGVLGVITQVTLKLQPIFKRSITYVSKSDEDLEDQVLSFGTNYEFADFSWFPNQQMVVCRKDNRVSSNTFGDGVYDFIPFRPTPSLRAEFLRAREENQELSRDAPGKCLDAKLSTSALSLSAFGLTNDGIAFTKYPVIGYQNHLQASGACLDIPNDNNTTVCQWDPRIKGQFFQQTAVSINLKVLRSFIKDVQKLAKMEPMAFCSLELHYGVFMRYIKASTAYLGKDEDAMDFEFTYYRSKDPMTPRLFEDVMEEVEQLALFKYGGTPHWGKNRNLAFIKVIDKYPNGKSFIEVKKEYDPYGLFSSEWTDQILGLKGGVTIDKDGCALEGLCICSKDSHCAPNKGYFCRPGKVYKNARVCSYLSINFNLSSNNYMFKSRLD